MKLLLIEDDRDLLKSILIYFNENGYNCESSRTVSEAKEKISAHNYDCIILDLSLTDGNGLDLIPQINKKNSETGIIILSANSNLDYKIMGLDLGADDYMTKPFHLTELNSRVKSIIRRKKQKGSNLIEFNEISVDTSSNQVSVGESRLKLTKREFDLLLFFLHNQDRIITKTSISEHLWGDYMDVGDSADSVYSHLKNLKKKLTAAGAKNYVQSVYGVGYIFKDNEKE